MRLIVLVALVVLSTALLPQTPPLHSEHRVWNVDPALPIPGVALRLARDAVDGFNLALDVSNFTFTPERVNTENEPNTGHAHLYINGQKIARLYGPWMHLPGKLWQPGLNRVRVLLNANDHSFWGAAGEPIGADVWMDPRAKDDAVVRAPLTYTLAWKQGRAQRETGGGWRTRSDLGFDVFVREGRIVTLGLELITCHDPAPMAWNLLAPVSVFAGHNSLVPTESRLTKPVVEDVAMAAEVSTSSVLVTGPEYCDAHYLAAVIEVTGRWRHGDLEEEFHLSERTAFGANTTLAGRRSVVGGVRARIERRLDSLFDGIDFRQGTPSEWGSKMIRNLVEQTRWSIS